MSTDLFRIILADDDDDDRMFFSDVLEELGLTTSLTTVINGSELMNLLTSDFRNLPNILFMDLNMPCKSGLECLSELKEDEFLKKLPIIIYSTSFSPDITNLLYEKGANYYIRKPTNYSSMKSVISQAINFIKKNNQLQPKKEDFIIKP